MKNTDNIVLILDSILDDYYFLWECYAEYKQNRHKEENLDESFSQSLKEAYALNFFNFYEGTYFNGEEVLISVELDDLMIKELLKWENSSKKEIRITTSNEGILFLKKQGRY